MRLHLLETQRAQRLEVGEQTLANESARNGGRK
jgi:hypothetical protein